MSKATNLLSVRTKFSINDQHRKAALLDEIRSETFSRNSTGKPLGNKNQLKKLCKNVQVDISPKNTTNNQNNDDTAQIIDKKDYLSDINNGI